MTENKMFCFQCQETAKGTGCTIKGVCGKEATTSKWQDLLLSVVRGIGTIQHSIGKEPTPEVTRFLTDALFTTITNANFNDQDILQKVDKGIVLKKQRSEGYGSILRARSPSGRREQRDYQLHVPCSRHHQQP